MTNGFIKLPRSLFTDLVWKELSPHCQMIFLEILSKVCYSPQKFFDHGKIIELEPGQVCTTIRDIQKWCGPNFSKNDIERSIKKLILCQFLRQEVRHVKSIITISHKETYDYLINNIETRNETRLRQDRDKIETQNKKDKKVKKGKEDIQPPPLQNQKIALREFVRLTQDQYDKLLADHGQAMLDSILTILNNYKGAHGVKYESDYHAIHQWVIKRAIEEASKIQPKTIPMHRERILDHFKNGEIYNGAECNIAGDSISFTRGMNHGEVKFNAFGFDDQLRNLLNRFGIQIPQISNGNGAPIDQRV